ncbi:hypothetical protein U1839_25455 [Sphingomonas sp. RT2P30]|uniref:hypothetical protein n=1 Tax=Parasphingomonas halimpatiens TaxID=3096162 RepID=UPI002FC7370C
MRRLLAFCLASTALMTAPAGFAQTLSADRVAALAAAERAADDAERAADEAERATAAARRAATAAREAANQARVAMGLPAIPAAPAARREVASNTSPGQAPDPNENLAVTHENGAPRRMAGSEGNGAFADALASSVANGANGSPLKSTPTPDLQFVASAKDKVGSLAYTLDLSRSSNGRYLSADQLSITASTALDDDGNSELVALDGFSNGTEVKLSYTHFGSRMDLNGEEKSEVAEARRRCLEIPGNSATVCNPYAYKTGVSSFVAKYYPGGLDSLLDHVLPGSVWFAGLAFTGNQASYKYLDRTSFAALKTSHFGYGGTLFGGLLFGHGQTSLIGSFDYRRKYKAADPVEVCQPVTGTVQTQCITLADGAPIRSTHEIFGLEFRHAFPVSIGSFARLAIGPRVLTDVSNHSYSVEFPIYFVGDGTGKLRGGIRAVYLNEKAKTGGREDSLAAGVFVGVPFSAFRGN